jgi:integrase
MDRLKLERFWPEGYVTSDFEADPFAWAEMEAIFGACDGGELGEEADYWRFAFGTGLRPSEQIELRWPRCDLVQYRVARRGRARDRRKRARAGPLKIGTAVKAPKTRASRRDIDLTAGAWERCSASRRAPGSPVSTCGATRATARRGARRRPCASAS